MKSKKSKSLYLIASTIALVMLIALIFALNKQPKTIQKIQTPAYHKDKNNFPVYKSQQSLNENKTKNNGSKKSQQELKNELTQMQAGYTSLAVGVSTEAKIIGPPLKQIYNTPIIIEKPPKPLSPMEKQASQSAVFFPGSAPRPINSRFSRNNNLNKNKQNTQTSEAQNGQENDQNDQNDPPNSNDDSSINNGLSNNGNNNGGNFPFIPSPVITNMTLQYTPSNTYAFTYYPSSSTIDNPLDQISSSLTLTLSILNPTLSFTTIKFCNSQYSNCLTSISLSSAAFTITTTNVDNVKPSIIDTSYISTSITIDGTVTSYKVPYLYFLLGTSDTSIYTQASTPFPTNSCVGGTDKTTAVCTITNSSSATVNILVTGTTTSGATTNE